MRYVIGVEAGPRGATAVVLESSGCVLGQAHEQTAHFLPDADLTERNRRAVLEAVNSAIKRADLQNARITAACLADLGIPASLRLTFESEPPAERAFSVPEAHAVLYAATGGAPGVVVQAGLGAVAFGRNAAGRTHTVGGWGPLLGDEGSACWIGTQALNTCCRSADGRAGALPLHARLLRHLETDSLESLRDSLAHGVRGRAELASLAEVVGLAATEGDLTARRLLRAAGKELALLATAALNGLEMAAAPVSVGTGGSVFRIGRWVLRVFRQEVIRVAPGAEIFAVQVPTACGAALMALEAAGIPPSREIFTALRASLPRGNGSA